MTRRPARFVIPLVKLAVMIAAAIAGAVRRKG